MPHPKAHPLIVLLAAWACVTPNAQAADEDASPPVELPASLQPTDWVVRPREGDYRRAPLHVDPVEAAVARGDWSPPTDEQLASGPWRRDAEPRRGDLAGGYAYAEFDSPAEGVMLLEAPGAAAVCLNGEWLPGDPYGVGWFRPPARVVAGRNRLLVHLADPRAKPRLVRPEAPVTLLADQATLPDLVIDEDARGLLGSIPLVNASEVPLREAGLRVSWDGEPAEPTRLRAIDSMLVTPVAFELPNPGDASEPGSLRRLIVEVIAPAVGDEQEETTLARAELSVRTVGTSEARTRTFRSEIDGSVQAYRVDPAESANPERGLLVALHDAGQSPAECLEEYGSRDDDDVLAPGGRGRWGFDWEEASRVDALEAIDDHLARETKQKRPVDDSRVVVVGRGMGGHGALVLGTTEPDRFAAVGVTDGWASFYSRGRAVAPRPNASALEELLIAPSVSRDPLRTLENLTGMGVSVVLTGAGRAGPSESRTLRERLSRFHNDFWYREATAEESPSELRRAQVDWLMQRRVTKPDGDTIAFATPGVGLLATRGWITVLGSERPGEIATVRLRRDASAGEITGQTENIRWLQLDLTDWPGVSKGTVRLQLDGGASLIEKVGGRSGGVIALAKGEQGVWRRAPDSRITSRSLGAAVKSPQRAGGFGSAFTSRPILVYGTQGSEATQRWAAAKARYDAHLFLYRGAGRLEVVADKAFLTASRARRRGDALIDPERSVVLYGSQDTNTAWVMLRQEAFLRRRRTLRVEPGKVTLGERPESGDALAVLALRPRPGSRRGYLGVVGGSDLTGMRMTTRMRYFWAGVSYPDFLLFGPRALSPSASRSTADDVRAAGWFDADWGVENGGILWRDTAI